MLEVKLNLSAAMQAKPLCCYDRGQAKPPSCCNARTQGEVKLNLSAAGRPRAQGGGATKLFYNFFRLQRKLYVELKEDGM
jgi:hypothetical protein